MAKRPERPSGPRTAARRRPPAGPALKLREESAHEPAGRLCRVVWSLMICRHHQMGSHGAGA
jgi:hypothetical protein